jgi:hypothetical protein
MQSFGAASLVLAYANITKESNGQLESFFCHFFLPLLKKDHRDNQILNLFEFCL